MIEYLKKTLKSILRVERHRSRRWFLFDEKIFWINTHEPKLDRKTRDEAWIVIQYHIIEKGLTMPNRRLGFGTSVVANLMVAVDEYAMKWHQLPESVAHAIGVVKAYQVLHMEAGYESQEKQDFWESVVMFVKRYPEVPVAFQKHMAYEKFYDKKDSPFPLFAQSRHTLRHYSDQVIPKNTIVEAVRLAMTAPSACNRQPVRVHCIANRDLAHQILEVQGGNRGFGHMADKVLIITSDLSVEMGERERNDPYVNGGIFLMNLCYALHYYEIAHCVLSCSIELERLARIRALAAIPNREALIAILSCGIAPAVFDVATSPRKPVDDILSYME